MRYLSVCSGIEAASVAWRELDWSAVGFAEIDNFPSAVLAHHFPNVPNFGDLLDYENWPIEPGTIDVICGGTPCQSFSVAGLRAGMADPRGNLALTFLAIVDRLRPQWVIWENVPGVLSSNGGRDFGAFVGALVELGYGTAYRILDAQYFGVAQRRRRVFVVANLTDWRRAAAVLFEPESLHGDFAKGGKARKGITADARSGAETISHPVTSKWAKGAGGPAGDECQNLTLDFPPVVIDRAAFNQGEGAQFTPRIEASETMSALVARGPHAVAVDLFNNNTTGSIHVPLRTAGGHGAPAVLVSPPIPIQDGRGLDKGQNGLGIGGEGDPSYTLDCTGAQALAQAYAVRRLTPRECERLQGFPDDWTAIPYRGKPASDGPRYKAIGNSMAVPVMKWIGERIDILQRSIERPTTEEPR